MYEDMAHACLRSTVPNVKAYLTNHNVILKDCVMHLQLTGFPIDRLYNAKDFMENVGSYRTLIYMAYTNRRFLTLNQTQMLREGIARLKPHEKYFYVVVELLEGEYMFVSNLDTPDVSYVVCNKCQSIH